MDRYGSDVLANNPHQRRQVPIPVVDAEYDLVVECATTGFCGSVVRIEKDIAGLTVELEDRHGKRRLFPLEPGAFLIDGQRVTLRRPVSTATKKPGRSASGAIATPTKPAQVARGSRLWVEGLHDAELIEKIWGDDLRDEAVVVEPLHGADDLVGALGHFAPSRERRVGVLLDHMVAGSKESRIAQAANDRFRPNVLVIGHPYVDVWQAVKPSVLGIEVWPQVPKGTPWKAGIIAALGWNLSERDAWKRILAAVKTYQDLEPAMLGRVEELIDFVTTPIPLS